MSSTKLHSILNTSFYIVLLLADGGESLVASEGWIECNLSKSSAAQTVCCCFASSCHGARLGNTNGPSPPICLLPGYTNTWCFLMMLLLFTLVLTIQVFLVTRQKQECTTKRNTMTQLRLYNQHRRHYIVKQPNKEAQEALPLVGVCSYKYSTIIFSEIFQDFSGLVPN